MRKTKLGLLIASHNYIDLIPKTAEETMIKKSTFLTLSALACMLFSNLGQAANTQLPQLVKSFVRQAFASQAESYSRVEVIVGRLDSRLKLTPCKQPLKHKVHSQTLKPGRILVQTQCPGAHPWKIYLPVTIKAYRAVVVSRTNIARGQVLKVEDLELQEREVSQHKNFGLHRLNQAVNQVAKRHIRSGHVLSPMHIEPPKIIQRGSKIDIVANSGRVSVSMSGTALSDGRLGDLINVKNISSNKILRAKVIAPGRVATNS